MSLTDEDIERIARAVVNLINATQNSALLRHKNAPAYLAMDRNRFNKEIRPHMLEVKMGEQGIAYYRKHLDSIAEAYVSTHGKPNKQYEEELWDNHAFLGSLKSQTAFGTSTSNYEENEFVKVAEQVTGTKQ
ncbi:MAG: hypothetical protein ABW087_00370 [Candidatus Thiodiazotropha sp.]